MDIYSQSGPEREFDWDDAKADANLEKHGIDFQGAIRIFESGSVLETRTERKDEERWKAIGVVEGIEIAVVYTWRGGRRRIISARKAKKNERQAYRQTQSGQAEEG